MVTYETSTAVKKNIRETEILPCLPGVYDLVRENHWAPKLLTSHALKLRISTTCVLMDFDVIKGPPDTLVSFTQQSFIKG